MAVVDGTGRTVFGDNSSRAPGGGQWSVAGPLRDDEAAVFPGATTTGAGFGSGPRGQIMLRLEAEAGEGGYTLTLSAHHAPSGRLLSETRLKGVGGKHVDGGLALVSHGTPAAGRAGWWFEDWNVSGSKLERHDDRAFGPVLCALHTLSRGVLKMTAQMGPIGKQDTPLADLQIRSGTARSSSSSDKKRAPALWSRIGVAKTPE